MHRVSNHNRGGQKREVLEFDFGVRVYPPASDGGYWRIRWGGAPPAAGYHAPEPGGRDREGVGGRRAARAVGAHRAGAREGLA
jgi:hypothetical protein